MKTSSSTIAMTSVRPSSTTNGVMKIGLSATATLTASTIATITRRSVSSPSSDGRSGVVEETALMTTPRPMNTSDGPPRGRGPPWDDPSSDEYIGRSPEGTRAALGAARRSARRVQIDTACLMTRRYRAGRANGRPAR